MVDFLKIILETEDACHWDVLEAGWRWRRETENENNWSDH